MEPGIPNRQYALRRKDFVLCFHPSDNQNPRPSIYSPANPAEIPNQNTYQGIEVTFLGGGINEGRYVYGKKHGKWLYRLPSGAIHEGRYVYGMEHGNWMFVSPNGEIKKQKYIYGELQE